MAGLRTKSPAFLNYYHTIFSRKMTNTYIRLWVRVYGSVKNADKSNSVNLLCSFLRLRKLFNRKKYGRTLTQPNQNPTTTFLDAQGPVPAAAGSVGTTRSSPPFA
jgi:hypothetical protein